MLELQAKVVVLPAATDVGMAVSVTVGAGNKVTVVELMAEPPAPVQLSVKVESALIAAVASLPLVALLPAQAPLAVHEVASVELQVNVVVAPEATLPAAAFSVTVGISGAWTIVLVLGVTPEVQPANSTAASTKGFSKLLDIIPAASESNMGLYKCGGADAGRHFTTCRQSDTQWR